MFIVINKCYGGFHIPTSLCEATGLSSYEDIDRTDPRLVEFVQEQGGDYREGCSRLVVVEVPEDATDWELDEYDGFESIIYVVDGKLYHT